MGLFENKKKVCPICGKPTPRIIPIKVEDVPVCKECGGKIDLPSDALSKMSLESFRQYLDFYDNNKALRDIFTETYRMEFGFFSQSILLDTNNRLFRLKKDAYALVMEASNLKSFCILEDNMPLFEGEGDTLICHSSEVPDLINGLAPQIAQFRMQKEMYEQMERMERERENREKARNGETGSSSYHVYSPSFDAPDPFRHFYVELTLDHPYWGGLREKLDAPSLNRYDPSIDVYMRDYQEKVDQLHTLAANLMQVINPNAKEIHEENKASAVVQTADADDTVGEIQKYKALLDAGIITEEEFAAKKRQLLGI